MQIIFNFYPLFHSTKHHFTDKIYYLLSQVAQTKWKCADLLQQCLIHFFFSPSESDDSDDEIIVKTTSWPTYQAPSKDSNGSDYTDKDIKNFEVNDESGGNHDTDDGVTNKAPRCRMNFHSSSDCSSAPAKSCSNNHYSSSCEHLHHKPQTSTKKANHQGNGKLI